MKIAKTTLINQLIEQTNDVIERAERIARLPEEKLQFKADAASWSALECLEHLNRYSVFYLPEIKLRLTSAKSGGDSFKSGLLGNYFSKSMLPKTPLNKMKTFKVMNPNQSNLSLTVIDQFIIDQKKLLSLLKEAETVNLTKTKTAISISKFIKLRLGDTLRVVVYHNCRHIGQAERAVL